MKTKYIVHYIFLSLFLSAVIGNFVFAQGAIKTNQNIQDKISGRLKDTGKGVYGTAAEAKLSESGAFEKSIGGVINIALSLVGVIFLILTVYGGYIWMIARGEESEAKKAKDIITMAVIGLIVVMAAYVLTNFVITRLTTATTG